MERPLIDVPKYRHEKILKSCSGYAMPGQTHYIMGASGAGKTTLLNALSGRIRQDMNATLTGKLLLNDVLPLTTDTFSKYGAYVMQDDVLFEYFTVQEAITFAARLKIRDTKCVQDLRVKKIIKELGLE